MTCQLMLAQDLIVPEAERTCLDAAWEHLGVPCVYLLGRPQLLFQCARTCAHACMLHSSPAGRLEPVEAKPNHLRKPLKFKV